MKGKEARKKRREKEIKTSEMSLTLVDQLLLIRISSLPDPSVALIFSFPSFSLPFFFFSPINNRMRISGMRINNPKVNDGSEK